MSKLVAGNWKMFGNKAMIADIKKIDQYCKEKTCEVAICPPFPLISAAHEQTKNIKIGAQKMIRSKKGITPHSDKLLKFNLSQ